MNKPEPIIVGGAGGFDAFATKEKAPKAINWGYMLNFPPFQMYLAETYSGHIDSPDWYLEKLSKAIGENNNSEDLVFKKYANWHKDKGLWKNETPTGEIVNHE